MTLLTIITCIVAYIVSGATALFVAALFINEDLSDYEAKWWFWAWPLMVSMVVLEAICHSLIGLGVIIWSLPSRIRKAARS